MKGVQEVADALAGVRHGKFVRRRAAFEVREHRLDALSHLGLTQRQDGLDRTVPERRDRVVGAVTPLHDDGHAATHGLPGADDEPRLDARPGRVDFSGAQAAHDLSHGLVVRRGDVLDHDRVVGVRTAVTDAEVIHRDQHDAGGRVVLRLAVARATLEMHVEVTAAVAAAGQREHDRRPVRDDVRQMERRGDVPATAGSLRHLDGDAERAGLHDRSPNGTRAGGAAHPAPAHLRQSARTGLRARRPAAARSARHRRH